MPRSIWNGTISFGLVQIPVGLFPAETRDDIHFTQLDKRDMTPIKYDKVNRSTGKQVPKEDIVRGHGDHGNYVLLTDAEIKKVNPEATQTIDILAFVDGAEIPTTFYEKPYYLAPAKKGAKPYALLREVLRRTGKVGIAKVVIRTHQYLAALRVEESALVLDLMRYAHELRGTDELELPDDDLKKVGISEKELEMAEKLVGGMEESWDPSQYRDDFREELLEAIERKRAGGEMVVGKPKVAKTAEVIDIMSLLKQSLEASESKAKDKPATAKKSSSPKKAAQHAKPKRAANQGR